MIVLKEYPYDARSLSFLSIIAVTELGGSLLKFTLNPDVEVYEKFVDPEDMTLDTSFLSNTPRSIARSLRE